MIKMSESQIGKAYIVDLDSMGCKLIQSGVLDGQLFNCTNEKKVPLTVATSVACELLRAIIDEILVEPLHKRYYDSSSEGYIVEFKDKYNLTNKAVQSAMTAIINSSLWASEKKTLERLSANGWDLWERSRQSGGSYIYICKGDFRTFAYDHLSQSLTDEDKHDLAVKVMTGEM